MVAAVLAASCGGRATTNERTSVNTTANTSPTPTVAHGPALDPNKKVFTVDELAAAYAPDADAGDAAYKGKAITLTGKVSKIGKQSASLKGPEIQFYSESATRSTIYASDFPAEQQQRVLALKLGSTVTIDGTVLYSSGPDGIFLGKCMLK